MKTATAASKATNEILRRNIGIAWQHRHKPTIRAQIRASIKYIKGKR